MCLQIRSNNNNNNNNTASAAAAVAAGGGGKLTMPLVLFFSFLSNLFSIFPLCLRLFVVSSFYCVSACAHLKWSISEQNNAIPFHTYATIKIPVLLFWNKTKCSLKCTMCSKYTSNECPAMFTMYKNQMQGTFFFFIWFDYTNHLEILSNMF